MTEQIIPTEEKLQTQQEEKTSAETLNIPVLEEQLQVDKQMIETGKVRIPKKVSEHQEEVTIPLMHEEATVEKKAINQYIESTPAIRQEGETMIIPVVKEVVVVEKRLMLVEELHVTRRKVQTTETQQVMLRKEEVSIERIPNGEQGETTN